MRSFTAFFALVLVATPAGPANAEGVFDGVTQLVHWFDQLNTSWNKVVTREERAQYVRSLDRLRIDLAHSGAISEVLITEIPDSPPDPEERAQLRALMQELRSLLVRIAVNARYLEAQPTFTLPDSLVSRFQARRGRYGALRSGNVETLADQLDQLDHDYEGAWEPVKLRTRFRTGLNELERAQTLATQLRNRIAAQR